jgi:hypothetical protein
MSRLAAFFTWLVVAWPMAGLFGAWHDQVSFTVSAECFTAFKFNQFGLLNPAVPERVRAAAVGFLASWRLGIPIGILVARVTFFFGSGRQMLRLGLRSYGVLRGFAAAFALGGLPCGILQTREIVGSRDGDWYLPENLVHFRRFLCAGYMHNSAYLGGLPEVVAAWIYRPVAHHRWGPKGAASPVAEQAAGTSFQ